MPTRLFPDDAALTTVCRRHRIRRRLALFGSTLKGSHRPDSDGVHHEH